MKSSIASILIGSFFWVGNACTQSTAQSRTGPQLFAAHCASCHGAQLQGAQGPSLIAAQYMHGSDTPTIADSIRKGYPDKGMPAWNAVLSEEDIQGLVQFIEHERGENLPERLTARDQEQIRSIPSGAIRTELETFRVKLVAELSKPWGLAVLPDGRILVTQEQGGLRIIEHGHLLSDPVANAPAGHPADKFHRILLDVAVHPNYRRNGWIYLTCGDSSAVPGAKALTEVLLVRGRLKGNLWSDSETLARLPTDSTVTGRIAFDGTGHVFVTTSSDAGVSDATGTTPMPMATLLSSPPQDLSDLHGKILRFNDDGSIPYDNPFFGTAGGYSAIWSYGHRNSQGLAFRPGTGDLWSSEHGPRGGDELNLIEKGHNYGWPVISYGSRYDGIAFTTEVEHEGMEQPVINWTPAIAVSAIAFYEGRQFPRWKNSLLVGSLKQQELIRVVLSGDRAVVQEQIVENLGRIRAIAVGGRGEIYLALELRTEGLIVRLVPAN